MKSFKAVRKARMWIGRMRGKKNAYLPHFIFQHTVISTFCVCVWLSNKHVHLALQQTKFASCQAHACMYNFCSSGNEDRLPSPPPKGVTGSQLLPTPFKYKSSPEIRRRPEVPELPYVKANTSIHSTKTNLSASSLCKFIAL